MEAATTRDLYDRVNQHYSALALYGPTPSSTSDGGHEHGDILVRKRGSCGDAKEHQHQDGSTPTPRKINDRRVEMEVHAEHVARVALSFGYSAHELADLPEGANLGVSCGNPLAVARLKLGETVIDLGSGAGFDTFLAAKRVGEKGMAIGVDMSKEMLARARANAAKSVVPNVKFIESPITSINLPPSSADCIISNCVINLVPKEDKHLVFREIFRLLRPGGRVAVSDILGKKEMTQEMQNDMSLYVGCISGAGMVHDYENWLMEVGFKYILVLDKKNDLNIYKKDARKIENEPRGVEAACCTLNRTKETKPAASRNSEMTSPQKKGSSFACCNSDEPKDANALSCCGSPKASPVSAIPKARNRGCCGISDQVGDYEVNKAAAIDFNEWVGSFSVYAVKP